LTLVLHKSAFNNKFYGPFSRSTGVSWHPTSDILKFSVAPSTSSRLAYNSKCADDVHLQMEHEQIEKCINKMCMKTAINMRLKKLIT